MNEKIKIEVLEKIIRDSVRIISDKESGRITASKTKVCEQIAELIKKEVKEHGTKKN